MFAHLERPTAPRPGWRQILADFGPTYAVNGFVGWLFAATGPVAIVLSVAANGGGEILPGHLRALTPI
jgi:benzoate membrane transport protein